MKRMNLFTINEVMDDLYGCILEIMDNTPKTWSGFIPVRVLYHPNASFVDTNGWHAPEKLLIPVEVLN